jgi:hypothetical protein
MNNHDQGSIRMWILDRSYVNEMIHSITHSQKIMITIFFSVDEIILLDILPVWIKFTSNYFCHSIIMTFKVLFIRTDELLGQFDTFSILATLSSIMLKKFNKNQTNIISASLNIHLILKIFVHVTFSIHLFSRHDIILLISS